MNTPNNMTPPTPPTMPPPDADVATLLRAVFEELSYPRRLREFEQAARRADIVAAANERARDAAAAAAAPRQRTMAGSAGGLARVHTEGT